MRFPNLKCEGRGLTPLGLAKPNSSPGATSAGVTMHCTTSSPARQVEQPENHEFQFRGIWLPAEVVTLLCDKKISAREVALLAMVESLVNARTGEGCYASNRYLGDALGVTLASIQRMLADLKKAGLINTSFDGEGKRQLWTSWSRPAQGGSAERYGGVAQSAMQKREEKLKKKDPVPPTRDESGGSSMLLPEPPRSTPKKAVTPSTADVRYADRLREAVVKAGAAARPWSRTAWAKEFALLRKDLGGDEQRMEKVLDWFARHIRDQYTPQAFSAGGFRTKWDAIEAAYRRHVQRNPEVVVSPPAAKIAKRLDNMGWPKGCSEKLPAVAQASLDAVHAFKSVLAATNTPPKLGKLAARALSDLLADPGHLVEEWLKSVHARLRRWKEWSGELGHWTWRHDRPEFAAVGRGLAAKWFWDASLWDQLVEAVNARVP